jgi:hypothetical protein
LARRQTLEAHRLADENPGNPGFRGDIGQMLMMSFGGVQELSLKVEHLQPIRLLVLAAAASNESSIVLSSFCRSRIRFIFNLLDLS